MNFASTIQIARSSSRRLSSERQRGNGEIAAAYPAADFGRTIGPPVECAASISSESGEYHGGEQGGPHTQYTTWCQGGDQHTVFKFQEICA